MLTGGAPSRTYSKTFDDKYLQDTRLRLRMLTDSDTGRRVLKLNKRPSDSIDVFGGQLEGLILCEIEANGLEDLMSAEPPSYARLEVRSRSSKVETYAGQPAQT